MRILTEGKKVYFASDFHLGAPNHDRSLKREKVIVKWLDEIKYDAEVIFLVGDLFDFWFEYKRVIPKGFVRFFGKLAELTDSGIEVVVFTGNHDMWMTNYLTQEMNIPIRREPQEYTFNGKSFFVAHGDGLGPGDYGYKFLKRVFESKFCRFLFGRVLHANLGLLLGNSWASHSWTKHEKTGDNYTFESMDKEILYHFCKEMEQKTHHDYYVFGHRHFMFDESINADSRYINLGDWIVYFSYGVFDGKSFELKKYDFDRNALS
jgi:UDP-2,3-diacylglucosamine hydrolase